MKYIVTGNIQVSVGLTVEADETVEFNNAESDEK